MLDRNHPAVAAALQWRSDKCLRINPAAERKHDAQASEILTRILHAIDSQPEPVNIPVASIREVRELTGVGFTEAQAALIHCGNDVQLAVEWLNKRGLAASRMIAGWINARLQFPTADDADSNGDVLWLRSGVPTPCRWNHIPADGTHWRRTERWS